MAWPLCVPQPFLIYVYNNCISLCTCIHMGTSIGIVCTCVYVADYQVGGLY